MSIFFALLIFNLIGIFAARKPDIDINRVQLLPKETSSHPYLHDREFIDINQFSRNNDYDDHSSRLVQSSSPLHHIYDAKAMPTNSAILLKVHQPREDPRFFYQSDAYLKENNRKNINEEVASIYPGREVIRADEEINQKPLPLRLRDKKENYFHTKGFNICVKCPHDRTLVAKPGSNHVVLQKPRLLSCSGKKAPRSIHFVHMYGPKFTSLLDQGSHIIVGRITHKGKTLQLCKMEVHVMIQGCLTPKNLLSHCENPNKTCNFTCRDARSELLGSTSLTCGDNMKWSGDLPICRVRTWCVAPQPPENGNISCQGDTAANGLGLVEGSRCRVRCSHGWRWSPRAAAVCRRGAWTHGLICQLKRNNIAPKR